MQGEFLVYVYTLMPDHLHILLEGKSETSNLTRAMKDFKQRSGYWFKQKYGDQLWQKRYCDHVLRDDEALELAAWYILNNPVRASLIENPFDYEYSGPFVYDDLRELDPESVRAT
ncbi:MAG: transposase [bacterium]